MASKNLENQVVMGPHGLSVAEYNNFESTITMLVKSMKILDGASNFESWYDDIKDILIMKDLWYKFVCPKEEPGYIETTIVKSDIKTFMLDYETRALLKMKISKDLYSIFKNCNTAREIMENLKREFSRTTAYSKISVEMKLDNIKQKAWETYEEYNKRFSILHLEAMESGLEISESKLIIIFIKGLPQHLVDRGTDVIANNNIGSLTQLKQKLAEIVYQRLSLFNTEFVDKFNKPVFKGDSENSSGNGNEKFEKAMQAKGRRSNSNYNGNNKRRVPAYIKCFICGENHYKIDCPNYDINYNNNNNNDNDNESRNDKNNNNKNNVSDNKETKTGKAFGAIIERRQMCLFANAINKEDEIYEGKIGNNFEMVVDSGSSMHMVNNVKLLHELKYFKENEIVKVRTSNKNFEMNGIGIGIVKFEDCNGNLVMLEKVLYVPKLYKNLLSVSAATKLNNEIIFEKNKVLIGKGNNYLVGHKVNNSYIINGKALYNNSNNMNIIKNKIDVKNNEKKKKWVIKNYGNARNNNKENNNNIIVDELIEDNKSVISLNDNNVEDKNLNEIEESESLRTIDYKEVKIEEELICLNNIKKCENINLIEINKNLMVNEMIKDNSDKSDNSNVIMKFLVLIGTVIILNYFYLGGELEIYN